MAGFNTIKAYDADAHIPEFRGLMQYGDGINQDPRYAVEAYNMETPAGVLQPAASCTLLTPTLVKPIETLARLYRRWYTGPDSKELLIAASDGKLYYMLPGASEWTQLEMPTGITSFNSNAWSWAAYETNPEGSEASVDVLLISNALDGMFMIRSDTMKVTAVDTPKKFGVIERYSERIWGGAITDDPDMLVYSAPYDPTNWTADTEIPEDGAGDIMQPSWDGDSFTALKSFGSQLIAFKKTRVWRILGTDPGEYVFKEQYGGGAPYEATIAVDSERIFMLTNKGVVIYDGLSVNPFQQEYAMNVFKDANKVYMHKACACLWNGKYYVSLPLGASQINNAVLIFNMVDRTWLLRKDVSVEAFLTTDDDIYFTSSTTPGQIWKWRENSWETSATQSASKWVSPWNDLNQKAIVKGGFEVYLICETKNEAATLNITMETEKKAKTKQLIVSKNTRKQKRLRFGGAGRRFRLIIESPINTPSWRLVGGVLVVAEIDPD